MLAVGHPRQRRQRLALRTRGDDEHLVVPVVVDLAELDQSAAGHLQKAQFLRGGHVAHHRASDVDDLALVLHRKVYHLLHAVHMGREAGNHELALRAGEDTLKSGLDVLLGGGEAGHLSIGGVGHQQVDPLHGQSSETAQVSDAAVQGKLVHLEVTGVQHGAGGGLDRHGERIWDGVVDREELQAELVELYAVTLGDLVVHGGVTQPVFAQFTVNERQRELAAEQGDVLAAAQQVGHRANVVLVAVGEHQRDHVVEAIVEVVQAGQDQVDSRLVVLGEEHTAVDQQDFGVDFEGGHVAADVTEPAKRDDPQGIGLESGWGLESTHIGITLLESRQGP